MTTDAHVDLHEIIHLAWQCVAGHKKTIYLSGPITTGLRFVESVVSGTPESTALKHNLEALSCTAALLRQSTTSLVLDPSPMTVGHWSQEQYMKLWKALIERRASEVRFMQGWEYSLGCALEFRHAKELGIPTLTVEGDRISVQDGQSKMQIAVSRLSGLAKEYQRLEPLSISLADELNKLPWISRGQTER